MATRADAIRWLQDNGALVNEVRIKSTMEYLDKYQPKAQPPAQPVQKVEQVAQQKPRPGQPILSGTERKGWAAESGMGQQRPTAENLGSNHRAALDKMSSVEYAEYVAQHPETRKLIDK